MAQSFHDPMPPVARVMCHGCPARESFLCSGLDDDELKHLAARASRLNLPKGRTLILEGDPSDNVYNVIEGDIALSRLADDGRRQILGFLESGDFIGLTLSDSYSFSAEALSDTRLCRFDRRSIDELAGRFPGMDRQVRRMGAAAMDAMLDLVFALGRKTAEERVASFLLHRAERQGCCLDPARHLTLAMTRADIADFLGLTLETVSRSFSRLKRDDVIDLVSSKELRICNLDALRGRADQRTS